MVYYCILSNGILNGILKKTFKTLGVIIMSGVFPYYHMDGLRLLVSLLVLEKRTSFRLKMSSGNHFRQFSSQYLIVNTFLIDLIINFEKINI